MAVMNTPDLAEEVSLDDRLAAVFAELVHRKQVLAESLRHETIWKVCFYGTVLSSLGFVIMWRSSSQHFIVSLVSYWLLGFANFALFTRWKTSQASVQKARVNFGVVRHHLIGMLEISPCTCQTLCTCKDSFRRRALTKYGINLY